MSLIDIMIHKEKNNLYYRDHEDVVDVNVDNCDALGSKPKGIIELSSSSLGSHSFRLI